MVLDFLFIYVFRDWRLNIYDRISQFIGAMIPIFYFARKNKSPLFVKTKLELKPILKTCTNGSSEMVTNISMSLVNMLYNLQLVKYAGYNGVVATAL